MTPDDGLASALQELADEGVRVIPDDIITGELTGGVRVQDDVVIGGLEVSATTGDVTEARDAFTTERTEETVRVRRAQRNEELRELAYLKNLRHANAQLHAAINELRAELERVKEHSWANGP